MLKRAFSHCKTGLHSRSCIVVGAQWGDEGKGKLVDILAKDYDIVGRFNGGANAGHTIEAYGKKFPFHLIPCGMLYDKVNNVLGNGVVVQIPTLFDELAEVENAGINTKGRLLISDRAHIVTSAHIAADGSHEAALGSSQIGTTKRGIGPTYCTKALRMGLRMGDLRHWDRFKLIYNNLVDFLEHAFKIHVDRQAELDQIQSFLPRLLPMITDTGLYVNQSLDSGKRILCEGANALMLDLDFGTYPYVTSSSTGVAGVASGLGLAPGKIESTIGVVKAYTTRVGSGPFPTEDTGDVGNHLQEKGREWGVTTGRRRRCGWLDLAVLKYTHMLNNYSSINITKLDILDEVHPIKVGVAYKIDGKEVMMPSFIDDLAKVQVEYETLPGWKSDTSHVENWNDLPENAKKYLEFIENKLGIPVTWVGVGPKRESMLQNPRFSQTTLIQSVKSTSLSIYTLIVSIYVLKNELEFRQTDISIAIRVDSLYEFLPISIICSSQGLSYIFCRNRASSIKIQNPKCLFLLYLVIFPVNGGCQKLSKIQIAISHTITLAYYMFDIFRQFDAIKLIPIKQVLIRQFSIPIPIQILKHMNQLLKFYIR